MPGQQSSAGAGVPYLSIVEGKLRQKVDKDTEGAVKREYQDKDTGELRVKYELVFNNWAGRIVDLKFKDGDFGKMLHVHFGDAIISIGTDTKYFASFAERAKAINYDEEVMLTPYDMEVEDNGKTKRRIGVSVKQGEEKLKSYYFDGKKSTNGIPCVTAEEAKNYDSDDWKIFFTQLKKFLVKEIESIDTFGERLDAAAQQEEEPNKAEEATAEDLPF